MSKTPLLQEIRAEELAAAAAAWNQHNGSASDDKSMEPERAGRSDDKQPQDEELEPPHRRELDIVDKAEEAGDSDVTRPEELLRLQDPLPLHGLPPRAGGILRAAYHAVWVRGPRLRVPWTRTASGDNDEKQIRPSLETLREDSRRFADSAGASSMAAEAASFSKALDGFDASKEKNRRVTDTEVSRTGMLLAAAASRAPDSEAALTAVAVKITGQSLDVLLSGSEDDERPAMTDCLPGLCRRACWTSSVEWLRAAVSGPEPILPVHRRRKEKLLGKRQVLFGVALVAPVALLTSAATTHIFPAASAPWIAGITVIVWIAVSGAVVANQYGQTDLELQAASCLGRLGVMSVAVLFGVYTFFAFFPSVTAALVLLVGFAVAFHGCLYATSCLRGDDQISDSSSRGADETGCERSGCRCCGCSLDV